MHHKSLSSLTRLEQSRGGEGEENIVKLSANKTVKVGKVGMEGERSYIGLSKNMRA